MLVTVDDRHEVVAAEPRWLDVVRWETCPLDAGGARDGDEVVARFHDRLLQVLPSCDDRLLALRVEVRGDTQAHAALSSHATHWTSQFRQVALDAGACRVWIEKVLFRTSPPRSQLEDLLSSPPSRSWQPSSTSSGATMPSSRPWAHAPSTTSTRKLPPDLADSLDTPQKLRALLDQVGPLLFERLQRL